MFKVALWNVFHRATLAEKQQGGDDRRYLVGETKRRLTIFRKPPYMAYI